MTQLEAQVIISQDPEGSKIATEITAILIMYFMKSGWRFWANPFFWISVGRAIWPLLEKLFIKLFKNRTS